MNQPRTTKKTCSITQRKLVKENKKLSSGNNRNVKNVKVLAERNPAVAAVGAWVESGHECQEHPEMRALLTEELLEEIRRDKEENLRRFQDAVRQRISQQAHLRKRQQLLKSYETVECEGRILQQTSKVTQHLTAQKTQLPSWSHDQLAICSPSSRCFSTQRMDASDQHTHVSKVLKQVRRRLATCQTVQEGDELSQLPGGIWKKTSTRDKAESHILRDDEDCTSTEGASDKEKNEQGVNKEEKIPLVWQHDKASNLHHHRSKTVTFQNDMVYKKMQGEPDQTFTDFRASQVLWPRENQEELKKQRQSEFLMYRRLFMDIEREHVKEHQRHRKHLKRTARLNFTPNFT